MMEEAFFKQLFLILTLCFFAVRVYYDYRAGRQHLDKSLAVSVREQIAKNKMGYRQFLDDLKTDELMEGINKLFISTVNIPSMRYGEKQTIETLINQETQILAKYLRNERKTWIPRIPYI
jgi:predicted membrane-bound dolichyl-phosphate-mannose-protein mannosyltransferase